MDKYKRVLIGQFIFGFLWGIIVNLFHPSYEYYNFNMLYFIFLCITPVITAFLIFFGVLIKEDIARDDESYISSEYFLYNIGILIIFIFIIISNNYGLWDEDYVKWWVTDYSKGEEDFGRVNFGGRKSTIILSLTYLFFVSNAFFGRLNRLQKTAEETKRLVEEINRKLQDKE